jgi:hypothetical protein
MKKSTVVRFLIYVAGLALIAAHASATRNFCDNRFLERAVAFFGPWLVGLAAGIQITKDAAP